MQRDVDINTSELEHEGHQIQETSLRNHHLHFQRTNIMTESKTDDPRAPSYTVDSVDLDDAEKQKQEQ